MAPKNTLKEDENPQEAMPGNVFLGTKNNKKIKVILPGGQVMEFSAGEKCSRLGDDGVYEDSDTTPVVLGPDGNPLDLNSGFLCLSWAGILITSQEQRAICISRFHRHPNRNIFVGMDGSSLGDRRGICSECQRTLTTIHIVLTILGIGVAYGLFQAFRTFY